MKIAHKISFSFLAVAILLTSIFGTISYLIFKHTLQQQIDNELEIAVSLRKNHIETYLQLVKVSVGQLSKSVVLENFLKADQRKTQGNSELFSAAMKRLARTKEANPSITDFLLLDSAGKVIASSHSADIGDDRSGDAYFIQGRKTIFIKDAYYCQEHQKESIAVAAPVLDSEADVLLGVLVAEIGLEELYAILTDTTGLGKTGEAYLVNKDGYMITPSRSPGDTFLKQKIDTLNFKYAREGTAPQIIIAKDYRGAEVLGANAFLPEMQWAILVEIDTREAMRPLAAVTTVFILVLIIVPLAAWLLGVFLAGLIAKPINKLSKGIEIIGSGNLDYKVGTMAQDEVGRLSRAFDKMTDDLKKTTTSIENLIKTQNELRRLAAIVEFSDDAIIGKDLNGIITSWNYGAQKVYGYSAQEAIGSSIDLIVPPGKKDEAVFIFEKIKNGEHLEHYETVRMTKEGNYLDMSLTVSPLKDSAGKVIGASTIGRDITRRKIIEMELKQKTELLEAQKEASLDGLLVVDENGKKILTNKRLIDLWQVPRHIVDDKNDEALLRYVMGRVKNPQQFLDKVNYLYAHKDQTSKDELEFKDGLVFERYSSPVIDKEGKYFGRIWTFRDITGRVREEARIKKLNQMQSALINPGSLEEKLKIITDSVVNIFQADFARIWLMGPPDRCEKGCPHAAPKEGAHACLKRDHCLHLVASSGRYTHVDGGAHSRVPFGCYKIGGIASGEYPSFLTNDVTHDPRVHNHEWASELGLVSFAGFRLGLSGGETNGVLALFAKHPISAEEYALMDVISKIAIRVIRALRTEEEVKNNEEKFRAIYEGSYDAHMILNEKSFLGCNKRTLAMFGFESVEDFIKVHPADISPSFQPDGRDSYSASMQYIQAALQSGYSSFEWVHRRKNGTDFPTEVLLSRVHLSDGDYLQATVRDITSRKKAEEQIELAVEEWERTFNSISDLIFIQDKDFNIVKVNKSCCAALKLKPEEIIGKKCYAIFHEQDHPWPNCPTVKTQVDLASHAEEVDDPRIGVPLLVTVSPIFNAKGEFIGSVHVARDISERKRIEKALRDVIEIKTNFTSTVSHELRTPLAAIKEGISLVLDGTSGQINKDQKEFLDIAKKNVDRLGRLINDILDFQKLESGKMTFNMQPNSINEVAQEVRDSMLAVTGQKGLDFILELDKGIPQAVFDRDRIIQVFANLVNNAVKFTEKGGIRIRTESEGAFIKVAVEDTGIGIKGEDLPRLFSRFEQLDAGMTRKTGGTGLGLSICKEIIEKHKGKIWAESEYGKGSIFNFTLPVIPGGGGGHS